MVFAKVLFSVERLRLDDRAWNNGGDQTGIEDP
jgi:hypothetical protein